MPVEDAADGTAPAKKVILIDQSKKETHHAGAGFKKFCRRLRSAHKVRPRANRERDAARQGGKREGETGARARRARARDARRESS